MVNKRNETLYTGITNDLLRRVYEHKNSLIEGFTSKYGVTTLVYHEELADSRVAIQREKVIKRWKRKWKLDLIESMNPEWIDLYNQLMIF